MNNTSIQWIKMDRHIDPTDAELDKMKDSYYEAMEEYEMLGANTSIMDTTLMAFCPNGIRKQYLEKEVNEYVKSLAFQKSTNDIVVKVVNSGPTSNRIDVVFMGDGYTSHEHEKFNADMQRMINEMFAGETFAPYLPLFNIWTIFRPSLESGLGTGGVPKKTAFGLYRGT